MEKNKGKNSFRVTLFGLSPHSAKALIGPKSLIHVPNTWNIVLIVLLENQYHVEINAVF